MKRSHAAVLKQTDLARERAVVRNLIEKVGWVTKLTPMASLAEPGGTSLRSNVIPFPTAAERARIF